jgi:hypothetical protein
MKLKILAILCLIGYLIFPKVTMSAAPGSQVAPDVFLPETKFDFKTIPDGTQVTHVFRIQNKGNATLEIQKVRTG